MQQYSDVVLVASTPGGQVRAPAAASVQVNITNGGAATLYSDNGITTRTNPIVCDSSGEYSFYAANGTYDLVISVTGFTTETKTAAVQLFDAAASSGAAGIGFLPSGTGPITGTVAGQLQKFVLTGNYLTSGNFLTAAAALTESAGFFKVRVSNGTAAAPALCGINFIDTGFYFATGKVLASLGGTRAFELNADSVYIGAGNVGAGGSISTGTKNVFIGENAARLVTTGVDNVFIGYRAGLDTDATGIFSNVVIGSTAGQNMESGDSITTGGFQEVLIGHTAGLSLTTGPNNTFVGHASGGNTTTGGSNTMLGRASGTHNISGGFNTYVGHAAGYEHTTGSNNTYVGDEAGHPDIGGSPARTGSNNVAVGQEAGTTSSSGSNTLCIGNDAIVAGSNMGKIGQALTDLTLSGRLFGTQTRNDDTTAAGITYTTAQFVGDGTFLVRSGPAGAFNDTTPTAAAIVAAMPGAEVGTGYIVYVRNTGGGALTLLAGSGVTLSGTTTVTQNKIRAYSVRATNVTASSEAVQVFGLFQADL